MNLNEPFISELKVESVITRSMLERIPQESFSWKPNEKSRTLGEIAAHIANLPGMFIANLNKDHFDKFEYKSNTETKKDILKTFDNNVNEAIETLKTISDDKMFSKWVYKYGDKVIFELPRFVVIRTSALNHLIHHRGQLSVYLRLLGVPLLAVYGPTADEI